MPRILLNDRQLRSLRPDGWTEYTDAGMPAFGVRVSPGGRTRTFFVRYNGQGTTRGRRESLGHYPSISLADARAEARDRLVKVDRGLDPALDARGGEREAEELPTLRGMVEAYVDEMRRRNEIDGTHKSWPEYARLLRREVLPSLGGLEPRAVSRPMIRSLVGSIIERGAPVVANRAQAVLSALYSWAVDSGEWGVETPPAWRMRRLYSESPRERALSWGEIRALWRSLDADPSTAARALQFALLTGARRSEVLGLPRAGEIDGGGWWTIPARRCGRKNGLPHRLFLPPVAQAILARCPTGSRWYFPSSGTEGDDHLLRIDKHVYSHRETSGVADWSTHVLRATLTTRLSELGAADEVIAALAGHRPRGVTARVYIRTMHRMDDPKRHALERWSSAVEAVVSSQENEQVLAELAHTVGRLRVGPA